MTSKLIINMPKRIRVTSKGGMDGGLDKRFEAFRERQRQQSRENFNLFPKRKKPKEKPIPVKPFNGIPEIQAINLSDYSDVSHAVNRVISPSKGLEKAIACVMINLLLSHSDIYEPGKSYSRAERQYTGGQLRVFRDALSAAEVSFDIFGAIYQSSAGRFEDGIKYHARNLESLLEKDFWIMEGSTYDIVYLRDPSGIAPKEGSIDAEEIAEEIVGKRYEGRLKEMETYFSGVGEAEEKRLEEYLEPQGVKTDRDIDEETLIKTFRQYLDENQDMPDELKEILAKMIEAADLKEQEEQEVQEEMKKLPDATEIAARFSKNIKPNGILILESTEVKDIPGLRLVDSYDSVYLYQKE
jgi:hypothetical protein